MPSYGDMWFFINKNTTASDLVDMCKKEDSQVFKISMLK